MKKLISSVMVMVMAFSLCVPAIAADTTGAHPQMEIAEMTMADLSEAYKTDKSLTSQYEKAAEDAVLLQSRITDDAVIDDLSIIDLDILASIVEANSLTTLEADNLVNTWQTCERATSDTDVDRKYAEISLAQAQNKMLNAGISPYSYSGNITTYVTPEDHSGVHYMVRANPGFNKASGSFTFPTLNMKSSLADPDVPYGFFGIYVGEDLGFDLGTFYVQAEGKWHFFISGAARNSLGTLTGHYKEIKTTITPGSISSVNFVASITKGSTYDTLTLAIVNASNWASIGVITLNTCDKGYYRNEDGSNENVEQVGSSRSYVNADYSNVVINREVTLAHDPQSYRPVTGTTIVGAKWSDVYLYNPSTYSIWGTALTEFAAKMGQTIAYANMVNVAVTTKWSEDTTNIYYR